jgi:hypothetical protein
VADAELFDYISSYRRHMFDAGGGMPSKVARSRPYDFAQARRVACLEPGDSLFEPCVVKVRLSAAVAV